MMPAEKKYQYSYENSYKRYGSGLRPAEPRTPRIVKKKVILQLRDKLMVLLLIFLTGAVGVGVVLATTYATVLQYEINQTQREVDHLYGEIENLEVQIKGKVGVDVIERRAMEELGMVYPTAEQCIVLSEEPPKINDFAQYIKENAYQLW
jgi:cell division protein FtsL